MTLELVGMGLDELRGMELGLLSKFGTRELMLERKALVVFGSKLMPGRSESTQTATVLAVGVAIPVMGVTMVVAVGVAIPVVGVVTGADIEMVI